MHRFVRGVAAVCAAGLIALPLAGGAQQGAPAPASSPSPGPTPGPGAVSVPFADPYPSTYVPFASRPTVIRNVTLLTAAGPAIRNGSILLRDGKIAAVGADVAAPSDAAVIDGRGKYVTPGIIDIHSHLGDYPAPNMQAHSDGNEATSPNTANVWAEHSVWPQDPQFPRALAGGVTTLQVLPGSANLIGGRSAVLKVVPARTVQAMKFPGARYGLKMACGENPKRVYAARGPSTRMGNMAGYRAAWIAAEAYKRRWDAWNATHKGDPPGRDLAMETMAGALRGDIYVHMHCYRADEMAQVIDMSHEFGYKVRAFHHAIEAYKIADLLAKEGIAATMWADWGGFKMEALDTVRANIGLVDAAGARATIHSDDPSGIQRLNQEVAKAMYAAKRAGLPVTEDVAIRWMTINPAYALGLDERIGSLKAGKNADVVLWDGDPFSVYTHAEKTWVDGALLYDRDDPGAQWRTDFELGYVRTAVRK
jgi:imidazolonepropionase-like amidohydrolase